MTAGLALEIEFLLGTCFAAVGPDTEVADWPPQPDRVFSALVATWGARGEHPDEAEALTWLEAQAPPVIDAPNAYARTAPMVFVPPNDPETGRTGNPAVLPSLRKRKDRRFPASRPEPPVMRLIWPDVEVSDRIVRALNAMAADMSYLGHSTSLTRCRFTTLDSSIDIALPRQPFRRVYPGRLNELRQGFEAFTRSNGKRGRPSPGVRVAAQRQSERSRYSTFSARWLFLDHVDGAMPELRAAAMVSKGIRDTLLAGYGRLGFGDAIPEVISGHSSDGQPAKNPHAAIVPLAFTGFEHADGQVMGFALIPPVDSNVLDDETFRRVLRSLAPLDESRGRRVLTVVTGAGEHRIELRLAPSFEPPSARSFGADLYTRSSRLFGSATPIVLDRHLKQKGASRTAEIAEQIASACRNTGLPEPEVVIPDKHSAVRGVPSAYPSTSSPRWMRWRVPDAYSSRQLMHAVIRFREPVDGPVLLGAGRFVGLGLCRPLERRGAA